jgi:hypothetical protein
MKRTTSIDALLRRSRDGLAPLKVAYDKSLHEKTIGADLRIDIKNMFENLRSCLDYLAHEIFEVHCSAEQTSSRLYFPIRSSQAEFQQAIARDYPGINSKCPALVAYLETLQPFNAPWLGAFNRLNNLNKHQDLTEQVRTETKSVTVSSGGGSVSWGPGVTFGSGVSVMGVPIDPRTQLPVPNNRVQTTITTWVDFKFTEINESAYPFIENSVRTVEGICQEIPKYCSAQVGS